VPVKTQVGDLRVYRWSPTDAQRQSTSGTAVTFSVFTTEKWRGGQEFNLTIESLLCFGH